VNLMVTFALVLSLTVEIHVLLLLEPTTHNWQHTTHH
jgi:hypothetical protein